MKAPISISTCALALLLAGCGQTPPPVDKAAIEKTIRDGEAAWSKDIAAKDVDKWLSHYSSDAIVMGGGPAAKGTDAIRASLTGMVKDPVLQVSLSPAKVEVSDAGDMVATQGTYSMTMTSPVTKKPIDDKGTYVTVYHKQTDGSWKATLDIITSDGPPPAPAATVKKAVAKARKKKR